MNKTEAIVFTNIKRGHTVESNMTLMKAKDKIGKPFQIYTAWVYNECTSCIRSTPLKTITVKQCDQIPYTFKKSIVQNNKQTKKIFDISQANMATGEGNKRGLF